MDVLSLTVAAGSWLIMGDALVYTTDGGGPFGIGLELTDSTNVLATCNGTEVNNGDLEGLSAHTIDTFGSTTTVKLRARCAGTNGKCLMNYPSDPGLHTTRLSAIQLA
jgi:hypothetical protein